MSIERMVKRILQLGKEIEQTEKKLGELKAARYMLQTVDLPEAMTTFGSSVWEDDRYAAKVNFKIYGSLPREEDLRNAAIEHIREIEEEGIIKAELRAAFGRGDIRFANRMARILRKKVNDEGRDDPVDVGLDVHPMTLQAMARQRVQQNKPVRLDALGLRGLTLAEVKEK